MTKYDFANDMYDPKNIQITLTFGIRGPQMDGMSAQ